MARAGYRKWWNGPDVFFGAGCRFLDGSNGRPAARLVWPCALVSTRRDAASSRWRPRRPVCANQIPPRLTIAKSSGQTEFQPRLDMRITCQLCGRVMVGPSPIRNWRMTIKVSNTQAVLVPLSRSPAVIASKRRRTAGPLRLAQRKREPRRADLVSLVPPLLELGQDVCSPTQSCILSCVGPRSRHLVSAILASEDKAVVSRIASVGNRPPDRRVAPKCKRFAEPNFRWSPMRTVTPSAAIISGSMAADP